MFNLKAAIDTWRHQHTFSRAFKGRDLDELEQHLRDQVAYLKATGMSEEESFRSAIKEMGSPIDTESEYRDVAWMKTRDRRELSAEIKHMGAIATSFFVVAYRNLKKNRTSSVISLLSLSVAISVALVTFLYVEHVVLKDHFHENADDIFLVHQVTLEEYGEQLWGHTPANLGPLLQDEIVDVERTIRLQTQDVSVSVDNRKFSAGVQFADPGFLDMFTFPLSSGTDAALRENGKVILSASESRRFFGEEDPVGKSLTVNFGGGTVQELTVSGVAAEFPSTAGIKFDLLVGYSLLSTVVPDPVDWSTFTSATFVQVNDPGSASDVEAALDTFVNRVNAADVEWQITRFTLDNLKSLARNRDRVNLSIAPHVPWAPVIVLSIVSLLLLLMSCFNYMNISIAKSAGRLKEIGVRKVVGAHRKHLIFQFLAENILLCAMAVVIGLIITWLFTMPQFNQLAGLDISIGLLNDGLLWQFLVVLVLGTGILSGAYPALFVSAFKPTVIFKGNLTLNRSRPLTKVLLIFQFVLAFVTMSAGIVFTMNGRYHESIDWGYTLDHVLVFRADNEAELTIIRTAAEQTPSVIDMTFTESAIGFEYDRVDANIGDVDLESYLFGVSQKYLGMLGVGLSSGTRFSDEDARLGAESILVNESFVSQAGLESPIGKYVLIDSTEYAIAGVLKDFHSEDLFSFIEPSIFRLSEDEDIKFVTMTVQAGTGIASASSIQERYKQAFEGREPIYYFQNQAFEGFLEESKGITNIFSFIALLSLLISCLSIYALSSQNVANRMKEIGVRKVLGGSPASIAQLVNRRLFFFMTAAAVVAGPLAYYGLDALLDDMYAYRMDLNALPFILTYLLIIATTALTISSQTRGIRNARPADIMRIE